MTLLSRLEDGVERMDHPHVDPDHLATALDHVAAVNRWLGARRALLRHLPDALEHQGADPPPALRRPGRHPPRVLDIGTGSADLPLAALRWADRHGRDLHVTALDPHDQTLHAAARRVAEAGLDLPLVRGDGLALPFATGAFDAAFLSMILHHMDADALVPLLGEAGRVARGGRVVLGELERCLPNYLGARLLAATLWRRNPVTRHDGPLSVLRAFTPGELRELAGAAGLRNVRVHRHLFYRLVLVADA